MNNLRKRVGLDCRLAGIQHAGIGRYVENLAVRLPQLAPHIDWVYFVASEAQLNEATFQQVKKFPNVQLVSAPITHYSLAEQLQLPAILQQAQLDLLHVPHFNAPVMYRGKLVLTIHDLLWHEYKGLNVTTLSPWLYHLKHAAYKKVVAHNIQRAAVVFVPAQTIAKTITKYYPRTAAKIVVTKEGADPIFFTANHQPSVVQPPYQLLYVGSLYPHKNVRLVIQALHDLPEYELVVVGTRTVFQKQLQQYVAEQRLTARVHFRGYLSDHELRLQFDRSFALVQPSFSEGFGLTGIEAMAAGLPVLASQIPIFAEIYQDAALFFDPHSCESFAQAVQQLAHADRSSRAQRGRAIAQQYSWDTMVQDTLTTYQDLLAS